MSSYSPLAELRKELDRASKILDELQRDESSPRDVAHAHDLTQQADQVLWSAVRAQRYSGETWRVIGEELGITRQAAHERFRGVDDEITQNGAAMFLASDQG